jgi:hypothetical protein
MKSKILLSIFLVFAVTITAKAQKPITTLQHNGITTVFYGQNSFVDAYNASVSGDTLNLSAGSFTAPAEIAKGIKVYGSGHFPDSANVARCTTIPTGLTINKGADSLRLEGLYINGDINYDANNSINKVKVIRCRLGSAYFNSSSESVGKNNCSINECFLLGGINFSNYGDNFLVQQCIISAGIITGSWMSGWNGDYWNGSYSCIVNVKNAIIERNIFLYVSSQNGKSFYHSSLLYNVSSSALRNNVIIGIGQGDIQNYNYVLNNIFTENITDFGNSQQSNNYVGVAQSDIFINQTGYLFDYSNNYHLKNPELYLGTDGTQVGLYGGTTPFKDGGVPSNPQIVAKSIGSQTDSNGNLQISISVKAQDR